MRIEGYKINHVGDQGRDPTKNLFVTERRNKKAGIILPRTSLAGAEKSLQESQIPFDPVKQ